MEKVEIESFTLDHDAVKAPYVRLIESTSGPKGDVVSNFDLRFTQPNQQAIDVAGLHTLEHVLALTLRPRLKGYIDCSPFGCRTGFHLMVWDSPSVAQVATALKEALEEILTLTWEQVPGTQKKECGNYKEHSLRSAQLWAKDVLDQGISLDPYSRRLVA